MEFFDKLGKKASEAYKVTADKTGKLAKEAKIRMKINEMKGQIKDIYEEIGKKVYEKHVEKEEISISNDLAEQCNKIDEMSKEIENLLQECLELKDKKQCQKCFAEIEKNMKFCPECGAKQEENEEAKEVEIVGDIPETEDSENQETEVEGVSVEVQNNAVVSVTIENEEQIFDLALRKYITVVGDNTLEGTDSRVPNIDTSSLEGGTTATYKHKKDPVEVATGDEITYNLTIYNEGEKEGRATKVVDQLPSGIEFVEVVNGNFEVLDGNYNTDTNTITLTRVTNNNDNLAGYTGEGELAEETIQIKCRVTAEAGATDKVLTNLAWISEEVDGVTGETITTEEGKDRDSEPSTIETQNKDQLVTEDEGYTGNESNQDKELTDSEEYFEGQQDDDDFEKVVIRKAEGTYNIQLIKTDNTEEAKRLEGAEFEITFADGSKLEKQRTNSNGMLELSGIQITEEGTDIITIKETQAPAGYNKLIDEIQVEITKGIVDGNYVITGAQVVNGQENENRY